MPSLCINQSMVLTCELECVIWPFLGVPCFNLYWLKFDYGLCGVVLNFEFEFDSLFFFLKMDITIQTGKSLPELQKCNKCCSDFHCPFCAPIYFKPTKLSKVQKHVKGHFNRAVQHEGNISKHLFFFAFWNIIRLCVTVQLYAVVFQGTPYIDAVAPAEPSNITIACTASPQF